MSIWQHALHSVQPPIYDPLGYMAKAMSFWDAVERGRLFNPFGIEPTVRPPGTILMSYPFGFSSDFRGFHFRSVFLPIVCFVVAVYLAAGRLQIEASGWRIASISLLYSSLPMFYHFDLTEGGDAPVRWGLVDNFQAGVAALAVAALVRSLATRSQFLHLLSTSLAALTLMIKPSGLMVMALMPVVWLIALAFEAFRFPERPAAASLRSYALKGGLGMLGVFAGVGALCVSGGYLSAANFAYGSQVLQVWREMAQNSFTRTLKLFHQSSGEVVVVWLVGVGSLFFRRTLRQPRYGAAGAQAHGLIVCTPVIWCLGFLYWRVVQGGGSQIRYFYPFLLMGLICAVPAALFVGSNSTRLVRSILMGLCVAPAVAVGMLLSAGDSPPVAWQRIAGVNVSVGADSPEVHQAYAFLDQLRRAGRQARVYSFSSGTPAAVFENVGGYEELVQPALRSFRPILPQDWTRGFAVRTSELLEADYILISKPANEKIIERLERRKIDTFEAELEVFEAWLFTQDGAAGVEIASEGRILRVLRIVDRQTLASAVEKFVAARVFRSKFDDANSPVWWNQTTVASRFKKLAASDVDFEGIYRVHALSIDRVDQGLRIEVWWEELRHEAANDARYLFLHLVDGTGKILHNQQISLAHYAPPNPGNPWRYSTVTYTDVDPAVEGLGFGVYQPQQGMLAVVKAGRTDWGGRRVLLPLKD